MKESSKSLKVYFIIIALLGIIGSLLQVFLGIAFFSSIYTISALAILLLYYAIGFFFLYFGIEMYRFLKDSPKTLIHFLVFSFVINSIFNFLSGEFLSHYTVGAIAIGCYLIYNINKISKKKDELEERISKQSTKKQIMVIVGILVISLTLGMIIMSNIFTAQKDYSQEIIQELKEAMERGELEETLERLSE